MPPPGPNSEHLLSPQSPDVAVSSFSSFRNVNRAMHSMPTPDTNPTPTPSTQINPSEPNQLKPAVAQFPPESLQEAQQDTTGVPGFAALAPIVREPMARSSSADSGEELFAKALSPRSPNLPRSPFSFA